MILAHVQLQDVGLPSLPSSSSSAPVIIIPSTPTPNANTNTNRNTAADPLTCNHNTPLLPLPLASLTPWWASGLSSSSPMEKIMPDGGTGVDIHALIPRKQQQHIIDDGVPTQSPSSAHPLALGSSNSYGSDGMCIAEEMEKVKPMLKKDLNCVGITKGG